MGDVYASVTDTLASLGLIPPSPDNPGQLNPAAAGPAPLDQVYPTGAPGPVPLSPPGLTPPSSPVDMGASGPPGSLPQAPAPAAPPALAQREADAAGQDLRAPQNPYEAPKSKVLKLGDVEGAQAELDQATTNLGEATKKSVTSEFEAKRQHDDALVKAQDIYTQNLALADQQYQLAREAAHKQAAAETADWMQQMDKKAAEEPNPGRWWEHQSGFGKVMWLLSLGFGAMAVAKSGNPNMQNMALAMISNEIDSDMARQKDRINRQTEALRTKGQIMRENQKQNLTDLADDHTMAMGRWNAVLQAMQVKAKATSSADEQAALNKAMEVVESKKVELASKKFENTQHERLSEATQRHEDIRQALLLKHQSTEKALDRQLQRDLTQEKIDAQIAKGNKAGADKYIPLNPSFGSPQGSNKPTVYIGDAKGNFIRPMAIHEKMVEKGLEAMGAQQNTKSALEDLYKAFEQSSGWNRLTNADLRVNQAKAAVIDPMVRQMQGRFNADTAEALMPLILGHNPDKLWSRIKSGDKEGVLALLKDEIAAQDNKLHGIASRYSGPLEPGEQLITSSPSLTPDKVPEVTPDQLKAGATGQAVQPPQLKTKADLDAFGDQVKATLAQAAPEVAKALDEAQSTFNARPDQETITGVKQQAMKTIEDFAKANPGASDTVHNAVFMLLDSEQKARSESAGKRYEVEANIIAQHIYHDFGDVTPSEVKAYATRSDLSMTPAEIQKMIQDINEHVAKRKNVTEE